MRGKKSDSKHQKKGETGYWLFGTHPCEAALSNPKREILRILATKNVASQMDEPNIEIVDGREIEHKLPKGAVHQGIAMQVKPLESPVLEELAESKQTLVMLDQVTDPHNVGAILRSAAAFGVGGIICPADHAPPQTGTLAKSASGALELVPLLSITNLASGIKTLKEMGYWIVGLGGESAQNIEKIAEFSPLCLILGAEGKGLRQLTRKNCDITLKIPIDARMESLNVSNAAAIALYAATTKG